MSSSLSPIGGAMLAGYILLVSDLSNGRTYFVGRRGTIAAATADSDLYNRDPIQAGHTFAVHIDEAGKVTWSNDWVAVLDAGHCGQIRRVFHPGHGDPYAQYEEYFLPASLAA